MPEKRTPNERNSADPTPAQIRERTAAIRNAWSKKVAARRKAAFHPSWTPPLIVSSELVRPLLDPQE